GPARAHHRRPRRTAAGSRGGARHPARSRPAMTTRLLTDLLDGLAHVSHAALPDPAPQVTGLTLDSREVRPGDAFVALAGARTHGIAHAAQALRRGASCVLFEPPLPLDALPSDFDASDPRLVAVPQLRAQLGG